ncbi:MAG: hypothetical protein LLF28_00505 [Nitrospiraceae bacterium]|nr:hypothetical protein [Nitrospiraceae bacterium]
MVIQWTVFLKSGQKNRLIIALIACLIGTVTIVACSNVENSDFSHFTKQNAPVWAVWWDVAGETEQLLCVISRPDKVIYETGDYVLSIYKDFDKIFKYENGYTPYIISQVGIYENSRLIIIWMAGSGCDVTVFKYSEGKVELVFERGSKLMPEFVRVYYGNNQYRDRIIVTELTSGVEIPTKADIYEWGKEYQFIGKVPFNKRFDKIKS